MFICLVVVDCDGVLLICCLFLFFFFQAEDGIRDAQESRGLGDVYKRQRWRRGKYSLQQRLEVGRAVRRAVVDQIHACGTDLSLIHI